MDTRDVLDYYRGRDEGARLTSAPDGRLELVRTRELLERLLPAVPATVLDVGGGTGVYAGWLASLGHRVHVIDVVPEHVDQAAALPGVIAEVGDARDLGAAEDSVDAVLLLGPLYHLTQRSDRVRALAEARRVTRSGGLVAGAAISRYAALLEMIRLGKLDDERLALIEHTIRTGEHNARVGFMATHFHTGPELVAEYADAGLPGADVYGIEGPGWTTAAASAHATGAVGATRGTSAGSANAVYDSALRAARAVERDPAMHPFNSHLLVAARVPRAT
ncbi:MAG: class I SAM-dependent methyltransferase [Micromonosporaceae bacterium]